PANNTVYVSGLGAAEAAIEVIDMNGKVVATSGNRSVNIAQLPASMYIIKVSTDKATGFKTFVKE
ncbi:MAG TPA: T9SS type A sorting domain-containing protein, partial [Flavipsychrobacter sp.]